MLWPGAHVRTAFFTLDTFTLPFSLGDIKIERVNKNWIKVK